MTLLRGLGVLLLVVAGLAGMVYLGNSLGRQTTQDAILERLRVLLDADAVAFRVVEIAPFSWVRVCAGGPGDDLRDVLPAGADPALVPGRDSDSLWSLLLISGAGNVRAVGIERGPKSDFSAEDGVRCADRETATLVREVDVKEWDRFKLHGRDR